MALVFVASLAVGAMVGYVGVRGFDFLSGENGEQPVSRPNAPARAPAPATVAPPERPAPAAKPAAPAAQPPAPAPATVAPPRAPKPAATTPVVSFRVQVGAFRIRENAEILVRKLHQDGFNAQISRGASFYRVTVGAFADRKDADRVADELKRRGYDVFVTR